MADFIGDEINKDEKDNINSDSNLSDENKKPEESFNNKNDDKDKDKDKIKVKNGDSYNNNDSDKNDFEDEEIQKNLSVVKNMYDFNSMKSKNSILNFGTYIVNDDVSEKAISFSIDVNEEYDEDEDEMYYEFENLDYMKNGIKNDRVIIINDFKMTGKYFTAVNLLLSSDGIKKINVFSPFIRIETLISYEFESDCGYILMDYEYNKELLDSFKSLEVNIKNKNRENVYFIVLIHKEKYDIKENSVEDINCFNIESPDIKTSVINYMKLSNSYFEEYMEAKVNDIFKVLDYDFLKNLKFDIITKLSQDLYEFIIENEYEDKNIKEDDVKKYFKDYGANVNLIANKFFKNTLDRNNVRETLSIITSMIFFENTDIDFIIEKSGELYDLASLKNIENNLNEEKEKLRNLDYFIAEKNFTEILKDAWVEEIEIKNDKNELVLYNCEKIKVLKFNSDEIKEIYIKYIWSKYIGFRKFILEFLGHFVENPDSRNTLALVKAISILAKYDFKSIINKIKSDWIQNNSKISKIDSQNKHLNASFLLREIYKCSENKKNIKIFLKNLQNKKDSRENETAIFVYSLILADEINSDLSDEKYLISLNELLSLYEKIIFKSGKFLSNYFKYAFYILLENSCENSEVLNSLFEFLFKNVKKIVGSEAKNNENFLSVSNLFLYQIKEYVNRGNKKNFMVNIRIKKIIMYILGEILKNVELNKRMFKLLNDLFKNNNNLKDNSFLEDFNNLCLRLYKRLEGEDKLKMLKTLKGEY